MGTYSQEEVDEVFRRLGLMTAAERQRFLFEMPAATEEKREEVQVFIRAQTTTVPQEQERDAELA